MSRLIFAVAALSIGAALLTPRGNPVAEQANVADAPKSKQASKSHAIGNGYAENVLERAADGHFYAEVMVNGSPIRMLVDTGATSIALTTEDAQRVGLQFSESEFTGRAMTAAGEVAVKPISLDRVSMGPLEANAVDAAIISDGLSVSLLGQAWLKRVGNVTIEGDRMILR
jgi:aspartyl protease family protein